MDDSGDGWACHPASVLVFQLTEQISQAFYQHSCAVVAHVECHYYFISCFLPTQRGMRTMKSMQWCSDLAQVVVMFGHLMQSSFPSTVLVKRKRRGWFKGSMTLFYYYIMRSSIVVPKVMQTRTSIHKLTSRVAFQRGLVIPWSSNCKPCISRNRHELWYVQRSHASIKPITDE